MTTTAPALFTHRHQLDYTHSVSTGWDITDPDARYGRTRGVCAECGESVSQLVESGQTPASNRRPFLTDAERDAIETAHADALAADPIPRVMQQTPGQVTLTAPWSAQHIRATYAPRIVHGVDGLGQLYIDDHGRVFWRADLIGVWHVVQSH